MKKQINTKLFGFLIVLVISIIITGCSSEASNDFEKMDIKYEYTKNFDSYENRTEGSLSEYMSTFFSLKTGSGFLAIIKPTDVKYCHTYFYDNQGEFTCDGFALYECRIEFISSEYNTNGFNDKNITIRMNISLQPTNDNAMQKLAESIELIENNNYKPGTYVIPQKLINKTDYTVIINQNTLLLLQNCSYYAFIECNGDNNWLVSLCPVNESAYKSFLEDTSLPTEVINNMKCIKEFIADSDLSAEY